MVSLTRPRMAEVLRTIGQAPVANWRHHLGDAQNFSLSAKLVQPILLALALVAAMTLCLVGVQRFVYLHHVSSAYLIPVLIAAIRLGLVPALVVACGGVAASAFFFYPPIYDFRVHNPEQLLDLPLFVVVAMVTSQLAARAQTQARLAREREGEMRTLYAFSRQLAVATDATQIYAAIQDHLSFITGCRIVYFGAGAPPAASLHDDSLVPDAVRRAVADFAREEGDSGVVWVKDERIESRWLIRAVSPKNAAFGLVAIDVGRFSHHGHSTMQHRIDAALADATATLERLDVARAIGEAKICAEAETLRAALMGSVSHGLRTPLASIMGSASILVEAPAVAQEPRLAGLAGIVRDEAERLNSDIQRLLDASRISSAGVRPEIAWADAADIVNAAVANQHKSLAEHQVMVRLSDDLPLVQVDAVLIEQALCQVLDNAAKYSPPHSVILIETLGRDGEITISVSDHGAGVCAEDRKHIFERFYRGSSTRATTSGSGLGLWISRAFVVACGGRLEVASEGAGRGTAVTIVLPKATAVASDPERGHDE